MCRIHNFLSLAVMGYFTGREYEPSTGLYYFRARWYAPGIGRFRQEDPLEPFGYAYAGNNPSLFRDPKGKTAMLEYVMITTGVAGSVMGAIGYFRDEPTSWRACMAYYGNEHFRSFDDPDVRARYWKRWRECANEKFWRDLNLGFSFFHTMVISTTPYDLLKSYVIDHIVGKATQRASRR